MQDIIWQNSGSVWLIGRVLFCSYERRLNHRNAIVECIGIGRALL